MKNPVLNRAIFALSIFGIMVAAYLWTMHSHPEDIPCGPSHGCETVANSPYSRFPFGWGPPVAAYGTVGYLAIATLAFLRTLPSLASRDRALLLLIVLGGLFGTAASLGLTYLELFKIHAICKWCMASQFDILIITILALIDWSRSTTRERSIEQAV